MAGGNCSTFSGIVADAMKLMNVYQGLLLMLCQGVTDVF